MVGPSFLEIAETYRNTKDADDYLKNKIKTGGSGKWGNIPMQPHNYLPENELAEMVSYIRNLK